MVLPNTGDRRRGQAHGKSMKIPASLHVNMIEAVAVSTLN